MRAAKPGIALPRATSVAILCALAALSATAWAVIYGRAGTMAAMGGPAAIGAGLFLATWVVMMVAMMFPTVAPITLAFAGVTRARGEGYLPTAIFVLGYTVVWAAVGVVALALAVAVGQLWAADPWWLPRAGGAVIVLAGVYQFTPLKHTCLHACRSPLGFLMTHDFGGGLRAAARAGASHGVYCLGCCFALMAVLGVIGLMNVAWMAVIAAVFFIEKNVRGGDVMAKLAGALCIAGGLAVMVSPSLLFPSVPG